SAAVSYGAPTVVGGTLAGCTPASGSTFNQGVTPVICTASNLCSTNTCTFNVTVADTEAPTIACPASPLTATTGAGQCSAPVSFIVTGNDNCGAPTVVCRTNG